MNSFVVHNDHEIKGFFGDKRWLSNFYPSVVWLNNHIYSDMFYYVENAYQYAKLEIPKRKTEEAYQYGLIHSELFLMKPNEAKKWGKTLEFRGKIYPLRKDWDKIKYEIMSGLIFQKFYHSKELRKRLIGTGNRFLEETNNWHDNYWGNCVCTPCSVSHATIGGGQNNLGKILMKVREFWK